MPLQNQSIHITMIISGCHYHHSYCHYPTGADCLVTHLRKGAWAFWSGWNRPLRPRSNPWPSRSVVLTLSPSLPASPPWGHCRHHLIHMHPAVCHDIPHSECVFHHIVIICTGSALMPHALRPRRDAFLLSVTMKQVTE